MPHCTAVSISPYAVAMEPSPLELQVAAIASEDDLVHESLSDSSWDSGEITISDSDSDSDFASNECDSCSSDDDDFSDDDKVDQLPPPPPNVCVMNLSADQQLEADLNYLNALELLNNVNND